MYAIRDIVFKPKLKSAAGKDGGRKLKTDTKNVFSASSKVVWF